MTRIVLHPDRLPAYAGSSMLMCAPWKWWETRTGTGLTRIEEPNGGLEYSVTFGRDGPAVILTDPPAVHLLHITVYDDMLHDVGRTMLTNAYLLARVVWHEPPDPSWYPVPGLFTCSPGDYRIDQEMRSERGSRGDYRYFGQPDQVVSSGQQVLNWPVTPTQRVARVDGPTGTVLDNLAGWGGDLITTVQDTTYTPDEVRQREGLPPAPDAGLLDQILRAGQDFQVTHYRAPAAIVMHPELHQRLLMAASAQGRPMVQPTYPTDAQPYGTLFGMQIRVDANMTPGQFWLIPATEDPSGVVIFQMPRNMPTVIKGARSPNVLPESEVIDDIDRLVNDQVRPGPVDDYQANRYPKCAECGHDWHGLECGKDNCDCLNTDWIKRGRTAHLDLDGGTGRAVTRPVMPPRQLDL